MAEDNSSRLSNYYRLRIDGDHLRPALRNGEFVLTVPTGKCEIDEYIAIELHNGRWLIRVLVAECADGIVVESVNGNQREVIDHSNIFQTHSVVAVMSASACKREGNHAH